MIKYRIFRGHLIPRIGAPFAKCAKISDIKVDFRNNNMNTFGNLVYIHLSHLFIQPSHSNVQVFPAWVQLINWKIKLFKFHIIELNDLHFFHTEDIFDKCPAGKIKCFPLWKM